MTSSELIPARFTLDPPEGFTDTLNNAKAINVNNKSGGDAGDPTVETTSDGMKGHGGKAHQSRAQMKANNEYAIAVWDRL